MNGLNPNINTPNFGAKFIGPDKFMKFAENFSNKTKADPEFTLKLVDINPKGTDKFWLIDKDDFVISACNADFSSIEMTPKEIQNKLYNIFNILKEKHQIDKKIQSLLLKMYECRDCTIKKLMKEGNITRNNSFEKSICE